MTTQKQNTEFEARVDKEFAWSRGGSVRYVRARVCAAELRGGNAKARAAKNLGIVLDRSGSMEGLPLEMAKKAVNKALTLLGEGDRFSLVVFDNEVKTLCEGRVVDRRLREEVKALLEEVEAGAATNLSAGWLEGARCVAAVMEQTSGMQSHVLVLSDGQANEGERSASALGHHAAELRNRKLTSSAIGIGERYSQTQLRPIAEEGGGRLHDAQYLQEIVEVVAADLSGLIETAMEQVEISVKVPEGLEVECLSAYGSKFARGRLTVALGMLGHGKEKDAVFLVKLPEGKAGEVVGLEFRAKWRLAGEEAVGSAVLAVEITFAPGNKNTAQERDDVVAMRVAEVWHANLMLRAVELNRLGDYREAAEVLKGELKRFERYAEGLPEGARLSAELAQILRAVNWDWDERGRKEITMCAFSLSRSEPDTRLNSRLPLYRYLPK